jgi:hypothetical protein
MFKIFVLLALFLAVAFADNMWTDKYSEALSEKDMTLGMLTFSFLIILC